MAQEYPCADAAAGNRSVRRRLVGLRLDFRNAQTCEAAQLFSTRPESAQAVTHEVQPAEPDDRGRGGWDRAGPDCAP
jgi:hypothetical protein